MDPRSRRSLSTPRTRRLIHRRRHVTNDVIDLTEPMSVDNSLRLACDVAGGDQLSEDALELLAADQEGSPDMIEADMPVVGARQEIAEDTLGLDREAGIREDRVRDDGELRLVLATDDRHGRVTVHVSPRRSARTSAGRQPNCPTGGVRGSHEHTRRSGAWRTSHLSERATHSGNGRTAT